MTNKIIEKLEKSKISIIQEVLKLGYIPICSLEKLSPQYGLYHIAKNYLAVKGINKESFKTVVGAELERVLDVDDLDSLITFSVKINKITKNPFLYENFYLESEHYDDMGYSLNEIRYSRYKRDLKPKKAGKEVSLLLKSIRKNDELKFNGFSLTEIIVAWQTFHSQKVMSIPCIYSEDRGVGKTTIALAGGYLYDKSEDTFFENVNMGDGEKAKWGDYEVGTRTVVFDDVPNDTKIVDMLTKRVKSSATNAGDIKANKKGGGMITTNAYNQTITTNSIHAIPLDDLRDRRIHPINVHIDDYTEDELKQIEKMNIPMSGARDRYYPIMQKILNHLYFVYEETLNDGTINNILNKEVPTTKFKVEVATRKASQHRRFESLVLYAKSLSELIKDLNDEYARDDNYFDFLNNPEYAEISTVRNSYYLNLKTDGLIKLGMLFSNETLSANKVHFEFFKGKPFKAQKVNGENKRCVRFEMKALQSSSRKISLVLEDKNKNVISNKTYTVPLKKETFYKKD